MFIGQLSVSRLEICLPELLNATDSRRIHGTVSSRTSYVNDRAPRAQRAEVSMCVTAGSMRARTQLFVSAEEVVFLFESPGGSLSAVLTFLDAVMQDHHLRRVVERAQVKIYEAHSAAALLAFSLGRMHELSRQTKVGFHLGKITVQVDNLEHFELDGRVSPQIMDGWRKYESMVWNLAKRLGFDAKLNTERFASGRVELTAEKCLRRSFVERLF